MPESDAREAPSPFWKLWGVTRIVVGFLFVWAFLDKLLGLGYSTAASARWISGGSPTKGYLSSSYGPLEGLFKAMAGDPVVNVLFMLALAGIGLALLLGVGVRVAGWSGVLLVSMMWLSHPPWVTSAGGVATRSTNPLLDDHVLEALVLAGFALTNAGMFLGLGRWWQSRPLVARHPWLA